MGKPIPRQAELTRVHYYAAPHGFCAVFLAEARNRKEMRQIRELFDMVGQLTEVVPISHGTVMAYAVKADSDATLFGKIEWLLKTQFSFSLVERNFTATTLHLVRSLCEESGTQIVELPECGICGANDPFPARATVELDLSEEPLHLTYCCRCAAGAPQEDVASFVRDLVARDRRKFQVPGEAVVYVMPEIVDERPQWESAPLAIAG